MSQRRALVLRALGLGDLLAGVPALRAIRRALPEHRITLATPGALAPLVRLVGAVDDVVPTRGLGALPASVEGPDIGVNLHGRGPQSHAMLAACRPGRLVAFQRDDLGAPGPRWWPGEHERRRWCRLVAETWGVDAPDDDLRLRPPPVEPPVRRAVVLHPGAAAGSRRWPAARFASVARHLRGQGHPVAVTGSADESGLVGAVCAAAGLPPSADHAGRTDVAELAALVADAALVISNDTGTAHLAWAYGTPSVVLFGPTSPALWGPPDDDRHVALWAGDRAGNPHDDRLDPALARIQPAEVMAAADDLLARRS